MLCIFIIKNENGKSLTMNKVIVWTLPIKPLSLIVYGLCFLGDNVFAIKCIFQSVMHAYLEKVLPTGVDPMNF